MSGKLPKPPVPKTADVRHFTFMPLDVGRLRDSRLAATATDGEFRAAVLLWCAAWHQVPAGSLPDDDRELAVLSLCGRDATAFQEVREGALHGFIRCNDGRLYHPLICEKVNEALRRSKAGQKGSKSRWQKKKSGNATASKSHSDAKPTADAVAMQGTGTGTGTESQGPSGTPTPPSGGPTDRAAQPASAAKPETSSQRKPSETDFPAFAKLPRSQSGSTQYPGAFEAFWKAYPRNPADTKKAAYEAWRKAIRSHGASVQALQAGAERYAADCEARGHDRPAHVATWVNRHGWEAEYRATEPNGKADAGDDPPVTKEPPWRARLHGYRDHGVWLGSWGPEPGKRGCQVPHAVLAEFGFAETV
jgi:hypothetical protein